MISFTYIQEGNMKSLFSLSIVILGVVLISIGVAWAGDLTIPNTFTADTPAVAAEVNANFAETEAAVDDNNSRINRNITDIGVNAGNIAGNASEIAALTSALSNLEIVRTISIPARAMAYSGLTPISTDGSGLLWSFTYSGGASLTIKAPADYAGGNVTFHIFFRPTTATAGIVNFFIRPVSYDSGESIFDPGSVNGDSVTVSGSALNIYEQVFTISAARMTKDWWHTGIQRQGTDATYSDDVVVYGVAYEYTAIQ
jgi:hypothetical protein